MTKNQAMAWARKQWGKAAYIRTVRRDGAPLHGMGRVARSPIGPLVWLEAEGPTWQDVVDEVQRKLDLRAALARREHTAETEE